MEKNSYLGLLDNDSIVIKHPITNRAVKLHRVIALSTFKLYEYDFMNASESFKLTDELSSMQEELAKLEERVIDVKNAFGNSVLKEDELKALLFEAEYALTVKRNEFTDKTKVLKKISDNFDVKIVKQFEIGGYVQSLNNLDSKNPVWLSHKSKVFDDAKIINGSYLSENATVFGNATVNCSRLKDSARVFGDANLYKTTMSGLSEIKDNADVQYSTLSNSSVISNKSSVVKCKLYTGASIKDNSVVHSSELHDTSRILGNSNVKNCILKGSAVVRDKTVENGTFDEVSDLKSEVFAANLADVKQVKVNFNGLQYTGWAPLIPGNSKSLLYADKDMKNLLTTDKGLNIIVTAPEVSGKDVF